MNISLKFGRQKWLIYWGFGLLMDIHNGLARGKRTRFVFGIAQCEKEILEQILKVMGADYPIHIEKKKIGATSYWFFFESKEIVDDVIKLGGEYRKSLVSKFPDVPKEYLPDFVRGLWDGDGSAFIDKKRDTATFTCGSKSFVDSFVRILKVDAGIKNPLVIRDKRRKSAYYISLSPNGSRSLRDYIYNDCNLFLKRKRDIFDLFGDMRESTSDISNRLYSYNECKDIVQKFKFGSSYKFLFWARTQKEYNGIPNIPNCSYSVKGWISWYDFLGKNKKENKHETS